MHIPLFKSSAGFEEINAVTNVLKSGLLSRGAVTEKFEHCFAGFTGRKHAIAVSNGTTALHLAIKALGWQKGDEVITTPFSFIASSNALLYEGIKPVFADIDPFTFNLDPVKAKDKVNAKTKGILLVHIFGLPADTESFKKLKMEYKLPIIEDACEAIGRPSSNFPVSTVGDATVYSFYANKPMTTGGEGGMIVTDKIDIDLICRSLRDQGRSTEKDWLKHVRLGYNYRMTEMQAAIGCEQLKKIDKILAERYKIAEIYYRYLKDIPSVKTGFIGNEIKRSWFIFFVSFANQSTRNKVIKALDKEGIESHIYFPSIHLFPEYRKLGYKKGDFPVSEFVSDTTLALPFFIGMTEEQISLVTDIVKANI